MKPTLDFYGYLQAAFDFFNKRLFEDTLPQVMFTITRKKDTCGFFRPYGWISENGTKTHEIAVNPQYFITTSPLELFQTITHEQVHMWQTEYGKPSRRNYHNKEWADKMRSIGLIPVSENGKGTGQSVSDKPEPNGLFEKACAEFFIAGYRLAIVDRTFNTEKTLRLLNKTMEERLQLNSADELETEDQLLVTDSTELNDVKISLSQPIQELYSVEIPNEDKPSYSKKTTYKCPNCEFKVWGTANLPIGCLDCHTTLMIVS